MKTNTVSFGLLILRLGIGAAFIMHGAPKMFGGMSSWVALGDTMQQFGIGFSPAIWGFTAAFIEFVGGIMFTLGLLLRPVSIAMASVMLVATYMQITSVAQPDFLTYSHPLELMIVFASTIFIGAGRFSLDEKLFPAQRTVMIQRETEITQK